MKRFHANALPVLIGSLPVNDHERAFQIMFEYTPEIPLWVQLPCYKEEGMVAQFLPGLPGLIMEKDKIFINSAKDNFDKELLEFYEDYISVSEKKSEIDDSRFAMKESVAKGFYVFLKHIENLKKLPVALKGQITCPVTLGMGVNDQDGRYIYYNEQLRDALVKIVSMKAKWQIKQLSRFGCPVIIFLDAPGIAGFGSSAYISISRDEIALPLEEVISAIHSEGALAGIHVCANADWSIVLESSVDIMSFDAYSFFDRFILYPNQIKSFLNSGKILAWGIVPTQKKEDIEKETTDSLVRKWNEKAEMIEKIGIDRSKILSQSLITPSCGTGSLSIEHATKVLELTRQVSDRLRNI